MARTVFADGAGVAFPDGSGGPAEAAPPLFTVFLRDAPTTWIPAPVLQDLMELVDAHGGVALHEMLTVATSWAVLDDPVQPLAKLKLDVVEPVKGSARIVLAAANYAGMWRHIVGGGLVGVTTHQRMQKATSVPGATFADGMQACMLAGIGSSPGIEHLMRTHGWPH
jgi:hypothetical protein